MIYVHIIWDIMDAKTDKRLKRKEILAKFKTQEEYDENSLQRVMQLRNLNLEYPGNGKMYVDMLEKVLTEDEKRFCGIPD